MEEVSASSHAPKVATAPFSVNVTLPLTDLHLNTSSSDITTAGEAFQDVSQSKGLPEKVAISRNADEPDVIQFSPTLNLDEDSTLALSHTIPEELLAALAAEPAKDFDPGLCRQFLAL